MLTVYGVAFAITLSGIAVGFHVSQQAERRAAAIQAQATRDIEAINNFKGSLLEVVVHGRAILDSRQVLTEPINSDSQKDVALFVQAFNSLKWDWQAFSDLDEFDELTATEAAVTAAILQEHEVAIEEYIDTIDALLRRIFPYATATEKFSLLQGNLRRANQSPFIADLESFIEKLTDLAEATEEEYEDANEILRQASKTQVRIAFLSTLLSGIMGLLTLFFLSRRLLRPLRDMTKVTRKSIQTQNFDLRIPTTGRDEIGILGEAFNSYSELVKDSFKQQEATNRLLQNMLQELHQTQSQMLQAEKMSSLGQLVAGVAHEINNPVTFVYSNLGYVENYTQNLLDLLQLYQQVYPEPTDEIQNAIENIELDFIEEDLPKILASMKVGSDRISHIVRSLRNFAHKDEAEFKAVDIHQGLDDTLVILQHRLQGFSDCPAIELVRNYTELPLIECYAGLLNQVFMNIIANAIDALEDRMKGGKEATGSARPGKITIQTALLEKNWVQIEIADNGSGIPEAIRSRIFEPFFTTKSVGKGSGMGLSISYQIVVDKHNGKLECFSTPGEGTQFVIQIPSKHS